MIACDLGSNTFRVVKIDCMTKEHICEFEKIVKTAEGIEKDGYISQNAITRVIDAIEESKALFAYQKEGYQAVSTAALRLAKNGAEVVKTIFEKTGIVFEIIDGEKEANYTRIAVENRLRRLDLESDSYILLDLGGGSSEIVVSVDNTISSVSFNVGIVTIVEKYGLTEIDLGIEDSCIPIKSYAQTLKTKVKYFVGSSGTPTTIASYLQGIDYAHYDYEKVNGFVLTVEDMKRALAQLLSLDKAQRTRWVGVGRDDLIIAGVMLLVHIMTLFDFDALIVVDDGLREGVGLLACK